MKQKLWEKKLSRFLRYNTSFICNINSTSPVIQPLKGNMNTFCVGNKQIVAVKLMPRIKLTTTLLKVERSSDVKLQEQEIRRIGCPTNHIHIQIWRNTHHHRAYPVHDTHIPWYHLQSFSVSKTNNQIQNDTHLHKEYCLDNHRPESRVCSCQLYL
jgi:hypothetical protein